MKVCLRISLLLCSALLVMSGQARAETESWYTYWGFGFVGHTYEEPLNSLVEFADGLPGVTRTQTATDLFGFYWPVLQDKTALGFVISGSSDRLDVDSEYVSISQSLFGASVMHFFGDEIGDGFFLRGDLGVSSLVVDSSFGEPVSSDSGSGILLGAGYGIPVSGDSRVLITFTTSTNNIDGYEYHSAGIRVGGMW